MKKKTMCEVVGGTCLLLSFWAGVADARGLHSGGVQHVGWLVGPGVFAQAATAPGRRALVSERARLEEKMPRLTGPVLLLLGGLVNLGGGIFFLLPVGGSIILGAVSTAAGAVIVIVALVLLGNKLAARALRAERIAAIDELLAQPEAQAPAPEPEPPSPPPPPAAVFLEQPLIVVTRF